jgi:hypothetical protein
VLKLAVGLAEEMKHNQLAPASQESVQIVSDIILGKLMNKFIHVD